MYLRDYIDETLISNNLPSDIIPLFKRFKVTVFGLGYQKIPDKYMGLKINNNPDLVRELLLSGYKDLSMGNHSTYSHILEKDNSMIFVTRHLELYHFFD